MRRIFASLAALLFGGAVLVAGATPAHAACGPYSVTTVRYTDPVGYYSQANVFWDDCGSYKRLKGVTFVDNHNGIYSSFTYGRPSIYLHRTNSGGTVVAGFDGLTYITGGYHVDFPNVPCTDPCTAEFDGRQDIPGSGTDWVFHIYKAL